jgi:hypothetical protein
MSFYFNGPNRAAPCTVRSLPKAKTEKDIHEAVAYTAPGIVAHQSALKDGERMKIPQFDATM